MNLPGDAQQVGSSLELLEEFGAGAVQKMEDELELGSPPNMLEVYLSSPIVLLCLQVFSLFVFC